MSYFTKGIKAEGNLNGKQKDLSKCFVVGVVPVSGCHAKKCYWNGIELKVGDLCVVEEETEIFFGLVTLAKRKTKFDCDCKQSLGIVLRKANSSDHAKAEENKQKEKLALAFCRKQIHKLNLSMSLSRVSYPYNSKKAIFYFTAEKRVDFRELVKELSGFTKLKVEMRQIGVRDEAKLFGGCGPCGKELCCWMYSSGFSPVSIRMAKDQFLSLSPDKISGACGRLMCCLEYEHLSYKKLLENSPKVGSAAKTPDGRTGKVTQINAITETISVTFNDNSKSEYGLGEIDKNGDPVHLDCNNSIHISSNLPTSENLANKTHADPGTIKSKKKKFKHKLSMANQDSTLKPASVNSKEQVEQQSVVREQVPKPKDKKAYTQPRISDSENTKSKEKPQRRVKRSQRNRTALKFRKNRKENGTGGVPNDKNSKS